MEALVAVRRPRTYWRSDGYHAPVADRSENVQDWRRTLSRLLCALRLSPQGADARRVWWPTCGLARKAQMRGACGGRIADGAVGFGGGVLGGLAGCSGPLLIVWTDIRGYTKEYWRSGP